MNEDLKNIVNNILSINFSDLQRDGKDYQFTDISHELESFGEFISDLQNNEDFFVTLPDADKDQLTGLINRINEILVQINTFNPPDYPNPQEVRDSLSIQAKEIFKSLFPCINQLEIFKLKTSSSQANLSGIKKELQSTLKDSKEYKKQLQELLDSSKKITSRVAVQKYLGIFEIESSKYRRIARRWLLAGIITAFILICFLYIVGIQFTNTIAQITLIQSVYALLILKLFYLAILVYVLQQCVRNYLANTHQSILNEHRENCLRVFDAMIKSTDDAQTRDQVLNYLAKSIFESGETGFFPGKDISKDGPDIVQIFKDATKGKP